METIVAQESRVAHHERERRHALQSEFTQAIRAGVCGVRDRSEGAVVFVRSATPGFSLLSNTRQAGRDFRTKVNADGRTFTADRQRYD